MAREGPCSECCFTASTGVGTVLPPAGMPHQGAAPRPAGAPRRFLPHGFGRERRGHEDSSFRRHVKRGLWQEGALMTQAAC